MAPGGETLQDLGHRYWQWRAREQPRSRDDIPRLERPAGWLPDWSRERVARLRDELSAFEREYALLDVMGAPRSVQVDHALIGSALARARFELDVIRAHRQQPSFYVDQSLGAVFDSLLTPPPIDFDRAQDILRHLRAVPTILAQGKENLRAHAVEDFVELCVAELVGISDRCARAASDLQQVFPSRFQQDLGASFADASAALSDFRTWLETNDVAAVSWEPIGEDGLRHFLAKIALAPFTPRDLELLGRVEFARAVALGEFERHRAGARLPADPTPSTEARIDEEAQSEIAVRQFYEQRKLLSQPSTLSHYLFRPRPSYLEALEWLGVTDDLTSEGRLDEDAVSYFPVGKGPFPFFHAANLRDPRTGIVHEGAHYQQLAIAWRNPDPIRRHYYDSGANEGIAFYNEELLLRAGLFDERPDSKATIIEFMRLRALRVEVDVGLAAGKLEIKDAARSLATKVPMDDATAREEAAMFAAVPGQGLSYQMGKSQIERLLSRAVLSEGDKFELKRFHDYLWMNGNVPIALLEYELFGSGDLSSAGLAAAGQGVEGDQ